MTPEALRDALHGAVEGWARESRPLAEWCASVSAMAGHPVILAPPHRAIGELIERMIDVCAVEIVKDQNARWEALNGFIALAGGSDKEAKR